MPGAQQTRLPPVDGSDPPMSLTSELPHGVVVRPAVRSALPAALHLRRAHELADGAAPTTSAEQVAAEWEALGHELSARVWAAVTADGILLAFAELARVDHVFSACPLAPPVQCGR